MSTCVAPKQARYSSHKRSLLGWPVKIALGKEHTMRYSSSFLLVASVSVLSGCGSAPPSKPAPPSVVEAVSTAQQAEVNLAAASASLVSGRLVMVPRSGGVHISGTVGGLPRNAEVAFHVHERGDCSAVDASSAGAHFNPGQHVHGRSGHGAHHAGDMENLKSNAEGVSAVDVLLPAVTLGGGAANDIANRAVVVHANADDYRSQPAGNAGARVACGVIRITR
jgi:Cu-Zn family superoxide dismutase